MASSESTLVERVQNFVSDHKRVIICTAAVALALGGVAYYVSTTRGPGDTDSEKGGRKAKDKRRSPKGSKKRKSAKDEGGPILEERTPKASEETIEEAKLTPEQIAAMPTAERLRVSADLKSRGNTVYQGRDYNLAAELYTLAITVSPKEDPVYYSNRAACYVNMSPPKNEEAVKDCDVALRLDPSYLKALNRRGAANESLGKYEDALRDYTAATILGKFQNESTAQAVERVLKKLSTEKANEILLRREPRLPSLTFITAYFAAFRRRPSLELPANTRDGDQTLMLALSALDAGDYIHAFTLVSESLTLGVSWTQGQAEALNLRGTFKFLIGDVAGAKQDLRQSVDLVPSFTQSLVKMASVCMEMDDPAQAFECFDKAIKSNANDPDIYYHRGQVLFIMKQYEEAAANYTKSTELDENFVFSHIQLAVAQYKQGRIPESMVTFEKTLKMFPQRSEPQNYYGELLLDQQRFQEAVDRFDKAIGVEKTKPPPYTHAPYTPPTPHNPPPYPNATSNSPMNVLPLVNKGLALFQWKHDVEAAERCCSEALQIDPECEAAVATLAQLNLQQSKIDRAVELFARQAELSRTEPELQSALTYQYASAAQLQFLKNYPHMAAQLAQIARTMA